MIAPPPGARLRKLARPVPTRPLNVLMVSDHLGHANGVIHGASRYYLQVLPRLDRALVKVTLCILRERHPFADELERAGVRPVFLNRSKWDARAVVDLWRLATALQTDVLHCLAMKGCFFGRLVGGWKGIPAIIHLHDTNDPGRVIGPLQRQLAPWTARALAVSEVVARYTTERLGISPDRVDVLHNGLDLEAFGSPPAEARQRVRAELGLQEEDFAVLLAGRIVAAKGHRLMIGLMPSLLERAPTIRLILAGDGPEREACRQLARGLGVEDHVRFTGQRRDMPEVIAASDAAVMPSLVEEGFGYAALEAAAGGRPVVAFAGGAVRDIIEDGESGFVVTRGDGASLAAALVVLSKDRARASRMGRRGAERARRFDVAHHARRLEEVYLEVARSGGRAGAPRPGDIAGAPRRALAAQEALGELR